jgi:hypothetical protein
MVRSPLFITVLTMPPFSIVTVPAIVLTAAALSVNVVNLVAAPLPSVNVLPEATDRPEAIDMVMLVAPARIQFPLMVKEFNAKPVGMAEMEPLVWSVLMMTS